MPDHTASPSPATPAVSLDDPPARIRLTDSAANASTAPLPKAGSTVIELRVRNHPGTMSHITGLFARRAFNLDAIVCVPIDDGATSRIRLLVSDDSRIEQLERQLTKLHDVLEVRHRRDLGADYFARVAADT